MEIVREKVKYSNDEYIVVCHFTTKELLHGYKQFKLDVTENDIGILVAYPANRGKLQIAHQLHSNAVAFICENFIIHNTLDLCKFNDQCVNVNMTITQFVGLVPKNMCITVSKLARNFSTKAASKPPTLALS